MTRLGHDLKGSAEHLGAQFVGLLQGFRLRPRRIAPLLKFVSLLQGLGVDRDGSRHFRKALPPLVVCSELKEDMDRDA